MDDVKSKLPEIDISQVFVAGDNWLKNHGVITSITHNNIVLNLYMNFPKAKYIEYFMDVDKTSLEVVIYLGFWDIIFTRKKKFIASVVDLLKQYIPEYKVKVKIRRFQEGVKNESD